MFRRALLGGAGAMAASAAYGFPHGHVTNGGTAPPANSISITSIPSFADTSSTIAVGGAYVGPAPGGFSSGVWSAGTGGGTVTSFVASGGTNGTWTANVSVPTTVVSATLTLTGTGANTSSATSSSVSIVTPGSAVLVQSFVVQNWNASGTSPGFLRLTLPFKKADVPSGSSVQIKRGSTVIDAQFDERTTWSDGSLKFTVCHLRDTTFTSSESRTYDAYRLPTSSFSNTGTKTIADITGAHDFKVALTSLTATDNTATTAVGSGSYTGSFNTHMAVATRITKIHSGAVCEGWMGWGVVADNTGGAPDNNLKTNWYADIWKNSDGSIASVEIGAVMAQDWFSVTATNGMTLPNACRRNYDCALKDGGTTLLSYPAVNHNYGCQWITCINDGSDNRGRRPWVGGVIPTLLHKPDRVYWISTRLIPPYDLTLTYVNTMIGSSGNTVYTPDGSGDHRPGIDATGGYMGRGIIPNSDANAFCNQRSNDMAIARINAHAGLSVFFHRRSAALRTRPGETPDIANTVISLVLSRSDGLHAPYDFQSQGMPAPTNTADVVGYGGAGNNGSNSVWSISYPDSTHGVTYSGGFYLLEGERYHLEAAIDHAMNTMAQQPFTDYALPFQSYQYTYAVASGVTPSSTTWKHAGATTAERNFAHSIIAYGTALIPDNDVQHDAMWRFKKQGSEYWAAYQAGHPSDCLAAGILLLTDFGEEAPQQNASTIAMALTLGAMCEDSAMTAFGNFLSNMIWNNVVDNMYMIHSYRGMSTRTRNYTQVIGTPGGYHTKLFNRAQNPADFYGDTGTFVFRDLPSSVTSPSYYPVNGDRCLSMGGNPGLGAWLLGVNNPGSNNVGLPELNLNQEYYYVNCQNPAPQFPSPNYPAAVGYATRASAQISATLGGTPIDFNRTITGLTWSSGTATITAAPHGQVYFGTVQVGMLCPIVVSGATPSGYNGAFIGTIVDATHISYPLASNPGTATVLGKYAMSGWYCPDSSLASYNESGPATADLGFSNDYMPEANMSAILSYMSGYGPANLTGINKISTYLSTVDQNSFAATAAKLP